MGTYQQTINVPLVEIIPDESTRTITIVGRMGEWVFREGLNITFRGLQTCLQIYHLYPNGVTLINSDTSTPKFITWRKLFATPSIFIDAVHNTGWMEIK